MKVSYTTPNGRVTFEMELANSKMAFEAIAAIQELFEEEACGCCKAKNIRCDVREISGNKYFKLLCNACGATLDFGQHKDGKGLFVKRTDRDTHAQLPNAGWYHYQRKST